MSDEESFVILGTSPTASLEISGTANGRNSPESYSSLQIDTPGSRFTSLKSSQIKELKNAQENSPQAPEEELLPQTQMAEVEINVQVKPQLEKKAKLDLSFMENSVEKPGTSDSSVKKQTTIVNSNVQPEIAESILLKSKKSLKQTSRPDNEADIKLWSRSPKVQTEENTIDFSLEEYVLKSPLKKQQQQQHQEKQQDDNNEITGLNKTKMTSSTQTNTSEESQISVGSSNKTPPTSVNSNLATSFILGEIGSDILKTSVYSQFPSISMEASPEDILKLQNMVIEYNELKNTIKSSNNTMKKFYQKSLNWKQKLDANEEELDNLRKEIKMLRKQSQDMEKNFKDQIEAIEIVRKKDRDETVQVISEKNALLENLRAQIVKLEEQQLASFEFVLQNQDKEETEHFTKFFITRREHNMEIKTLQRQLSELLAKNLDLTDLEKQYLDELNCLKVNLTAAEELIKENRTRILALKNENTQQQQQIELLENTLKKINAEKEDQKEHIILLEQQIQVHRNDFAMEKESRELALKEKQQVLKDLRNLQKHNQELLEEQLKLTQAYERRLTAAGLGNNMQQVTANTPSANRYYNNPQQPIRDLLASSSSATAGSLDVNHCCPICNKAFRSLNILQNHVYDCLDRS
ncbi:NF-kappa-B essential modulator kenny isoform 2-T4 [Cochliomyia hominivorax]